MVTWTGLDTKCSILEAIFAALFFLARLKRLVSFAAFSALSAAL
jgi:hypothetical protein